jgi:hypothetical protein
MYRVPSEFIRQKNTLFGPITVAHAAGAFGGYLLAQAVGDSAWMAILGVVLGLAATTLKVQGLVLYQFAPLAAAYLLRKLTGDLLEAEEEVSVASPATFLVRDEEGRPLVFGEE